MGRPGSNAILKRIVGSLPVHWDERGVHVGKDVFAPDHNVPVLIFPNPLNPQQICGDQQRLYLSRVRLS